MADQNKIQDDILSYREMCDAENIQTLQRGMNFRMNQSYSVILMSQRANAPYHDRVYDDGVTIEYEGHDTSKRSADHNPKNEDHDHVSDVSPRHFRGRGEHDSAGDRPKAPSRGLNRGLHGTEAG